MTEIEIERLMWSWPRVEAAAQDAWTRNFAKSIARQAKRRSWTPSPKQAALMRRMVQSLHRHADEGGGFDVIER